MVTKIRTSLLNNNNIANLNNNVTTIMLIQDIFKNDVIVQWNAIWHIINRFQVQYFAKVNNQDIILFLI